MNDCLMENLNPMQQEAVVHASGPLVVFAGAGSGKTRVITTRIALLIEQGVRPNSILAVTFTNKATKEMKERIVELSSRGFLVHVATFHSACTRWLREFADHLGYTTSFSIYSDADVKGVLKGVLKDLHIDEQEHAIADYRAAISKAKTYGWLPVDVESHLEREAIFPPFGVEVYKRYQANLAQANAMDFNDLLMNMLMLLRRNEEVRQILQKRYNHILVDEYQDTNPTQFAIVNYLVNTDRNLCVVGDDDQSIYSWRGANPSNIMNFKDNFPGAKEIRLEQNYRCSANIIKAATSLVGHNKFRVDKTLWTDNDSGAKINFSHDFDADAEAWWIVEQIKDEARTFAHDQIAIFYRTNAQSRILEDSLRKAKIPYRIYGSVRFYDRLEIKDVLAYLRLIINPRDDIAFRRVISVPGRGLGEKALDALAARAIEDRSSLLQAAVKLSQEAVPRISTRLKGFVEQYQTLVRKAGESRLSDVLQVLIETIGYVQYLEKKFPVEAEDKLSNIYELGSAIADYETQHPSATLTEWLADVALSGSEKESDGGVCLMTLHSAKGLEFDRVYITALEEGLIPHARHGDEPDDLEEERRLLYVGITRARKKVSLSAAKKRRVFNNWMANAPSRFLKEIPQEVLDLRRAPGLFRKTKRHSMLMGAPVFHLTYGNGIVEDVDTSSGAMKVSVDFNEFGVRRVPFSQLQLK